MEEVEEMEEVRVLLPSMVWPMVWPATVWIERGEVTVWGWRELQVVILWSKVGRFGKGSIQEDPRRLSQLEKCTGW